MLFHCVLLLVSASVCFAAEPPVPTQIRLVHDLLDNYDKKAKPMWDNTKPINVSFSMDLYQILELNEPQQYILLNAWIIERWFDEFLYWNPDDYENITELRLPYDSIWLPDTTLYNSLVMKDDDTRRLLNAKLSTDTERRAALIELLYPTIYKFSCLLDLRFFPFDVQVCTMTFSSWTYDQKGIDYFPHSDKIGTSNYLENEGWYILQTKIKRREVKYACCPNNYTLLQLTLYLRRKPLFYLVNLIIPTSIITLIAIVGFFTTSSASGMREEKVSLGITTLLSMSILMLMVSDQMPTTSTFIPLIGWFILAMIIVISLGTVVSSVIIAIQKRGSLGERMSKRALKFAKVLAWFTCTSLPPHVEKEHMMEAFDAPTPSVEVRPLQLASVKESVRNKWVTGARRATQRGNSGLALISDKSTDPLIHLSPSAHQHDESISPSAPPVPSPSPLPPPPTPGPADDVVSVASELSSKFLMSRMRPKSQKDNTNTFAAMQKSGLSRSSLRAGSIKANRQLAVAEFEWLATVVERTCFVIFVIAFLIITFGINFIGFIHWHQAGVEFGEQFDANMTIRLPIFLTLLAITATSHSLNATLKTFDPRLLNSTADRDLAMQNVPLIRLTRHLLSPERYDVRVRPILDHKKSLKVHISISLYQIIEVDEPSQNIKLNVWMIQKWNDEYLDWNPNEFGLINSTIIPFHHLWIPDTYLYNSVKMSRDETERYMNIQATSNYWKGEKGAELSFLYPAIYTITCRLNIRFFPYDRQNCTLTISSWTNSKSALDYYADPQVSMQSFIPNEEWQVKSFEIHRHEYKYACCAEPWVILQASLVIQRKPLYYLVNLIIPTSIITLVAITGFFTPASTDDDRTEKINLGITTLLAMSILMLMVSDQMPTTSEFVPLIAWFYLSIIIIISIGTFLTSVVLSVQGRRQYGRNPPQFIRYAFFVILPHILLLNVPPPLQTLWGELDDDPLNVRRRKKSQYLTRNVHNGSTKQASPMSTLRVPVTAGSVNEKRQSFQMIDVTSPNSPNTARSRAPSLAPSTAKTPTLWEGTMSALAGNNNQLRRTSNVFNKEVDEMRRKRQCSLEWEFLATVLDRFLLIVFVAAVLIVTAGLILVGRMAQYSYDHPDDKFFNV